MSGVYLLVGVAGEEYALPVEWVREVAAAADVAPVPGTPAVILGVRNLRGKVLPVVDLARALGLPGSGGGFVAVVEQANRRAALSVDSIRGVAAIEGSPEPAEGRFVSGASLHDGALTGIVAVDEMLRELEAGALR